MKRRKWPYLLLCHACLSCIAVCSCNGYIAVCLYRTSAISRRIMLFNSRDWSKPEHTRGRTPAPIFDSENKHGRKDDDDAVAAALFISVIVNRNKSNRKRNRNVFTNKPNENNQLKPITTVSVDHVLSKIDLEIQHFQIWVENRSRFRMT